MSTRTAREGSRCQDSERKGTTAKLAPFPVDLRKTSDTPPALFFPCPARNPQLAIGFSVRFCVLHNDFFVPHEFHETEIEGFPFKKGTLPVRKKRPTLDILWIENVALTWAFLSSEPCGHLERNHVIRTRKEEPESTAKLAQCKGDKRRFPKAPSSCHLAAHHWCIAVKHIIASGESPCACLRQSIVVQGLMRA